MINVKFRVLGIYFGCAAGDEANSLTGEITVTVADNPTVFDVMKAVVMKAMTGGINGVSLFSFTPPYPAAGQDLSSITVIFTDKPRRNRDYAEGMYILEDSKTTNPNKVLQYYIVDANGVQRNRNNFTKTFADSPDAQIQDGDTIIWRQVSICVGPNGSHRAKSIAQRSLKSMLSS